MQYMCRLSVCQLPAAKDEQLEINSGSEGSALHYISLLYYEIITSTAWLVGETEKKKRMVANVVTLN
jgi:hypothetical protein